jgi:Derlin-2/3
MGLITIPIVYYPYALIALDLVMGGPQAAAQAVAGAAVGHAWWWAVWGGGLASRGLLQSWGSAPAWMRNLLGEDRRPPPTPDALGGAAAGLARGGVHVSTPRAQAATGTGNATTTGHSWGSGRQLGAS